MIRRNKIALGASVCLVLATGSVSSLVLLASTTSPPGSAESANATNSAPHSPVTVYEDQYIDDLIYVPPVGTETGAAESGTGTAAPTPSAANPGQVAGTEGSVAGSPSAASTGFAVGSAQQEPNAERSANPGPSESPSPARNAPVTNTTPPAPSAPISTTPVPVPTTRPAPTAMPAGVELPSDWPSGVPYPPIPEGCRKPHLEDNGVWNCEH